MKVKQEFWLITYRSLRGPGSSCMMSTNGRIDLNYLNDMLRDSGEENIIYTGITKISPQTYRELRACMRKNNSM